jgi:23S rRNA (uridine2552-2'-O)-methyltransferase
MVYKPKDHYFHKAKKEGFVARSAYKLEELQKKHRLIRPGDRVLDLGASPGSWSQVALKFAGAKGSVLGIDLKPVKIQAPNARFIVGDILQLPEAEFAGTFDVVISDMAPNTTGIRVRDQALSEELCQMALNIAAKHLKSGGHLAIKLFEGPDAEKIVAQVKQMFQKFDRTKPQAVRKGSFETYLVGLGKRV